MKKSMTIIILLWFTFIMNTGDLFSSFSKTAMINENTAVFYPDNFQLSEHLPSLILLKEPEKFGDISGNWRLRVLFGKAFGKNTASVRIDENTDLYGTGEVRGKLQRNGTRIKLCLFF